MPKEVNILAVAITIDVLENLLAAFREIIVEAESFDEAIKGTVTVWDGNCENEFIFDISYDEALGHTLGLS